MRITWFGQACFELLSNHGISAICDPYDPATGYAAHPRSVDIVTISHEHHDHNDISWIQGTPQVIRGAGDYIVKDVHITGISSFHDKQGGACRGNNTIFLIGMDGLRICHLGDLGHKLDAVHLQQIGNPDVLLIPVGGYYTINAAEAAEIAQAIGARLTIPMHFKTGVKDTPVDTVDAFAKTMNAAAAGSSSIDIGKGSAGAKTIILDYLR
jgi:L-ascorbate metabolism protein UlaG (beta-lactamase superfamily)